MKVDPKQLSPNLLAPPVPTDLALQHLLDFAVPRHSQLGSTQGQLF